MLKMVFLMMIGLAVARLPRQEKVAPKASLSVTVTNVPKVEGVMRFALFARAEGFREESAAIDKGLVTVKSLSATHVFQQVPPGRYAVAVYHDANNNGKLDTNFLGIPTESYGFSNNVMGTFGPPSFLDASFLVESSNKAISIKLR